MAAINRKEVFNLANKLDLNIFHFARGTYPKADGCFVKLPFNRFFIPISDGGTVRSYIRDDKDNFFLQTDKIYFVPAGHTAAFFLTEELCFISIQFTLELYRGIDLFSQLHKSCCICNDSLRTRVIAAYAMENSLAAAAAVRSAVCELAAGLLDTMDLEYIDRLSRMSDLRKIIEHIQEHCTAETGIDELAALYGCSRENFSRRFSAICHCSPKQYLNNVLTRKAAEMLLKTPLLSKEIAHQLGFANEFYFSRFFKKNTGYSPANYRKNLRSESDKG